MNAADSAQAATSHEPLAKAYLLNAATLPGWAMAVLMAFELCFIACCFREPPKPAELSIGPMKYRVS